MRKTTNINLSLYDQSDTFNITGNQNSLNSNFEIIDEEINALNNTNSIDEVKNEVASLKEDKVDKPSTSDDGKIPRAKEGEVEWVDVGQPTDDQTDSAVTKWLDKHPEVTTTVQDGVIGEKKIEASFLPWIKKDYVTPEMFGAVGDGVHDDTNAVQYCIDNFPNILFTKTYKITKPIKIENKTGRSIIGKGATIKCIECTGFTIKESETIKIDGITLLGESKGFPAFDLYEMKWRSYIRNCCISGFSVGIKTNVFDGCLVASIENLYIIKCLYAIDDSAGGLQGTQFIGGRIENNMNGILIASPNVVLTTTLLKKSVPITNVQKILGHVDINTTMIYAKIDDEEVKNNHRKFS